MSVLSEIAYYQNRRDEVPNQLLAEKLAKSGDTEGLDEIAAHLDDKNKSVASDCIKVLYETGYRKPELIRKYVNEFLILLSSKENRMVWGGMIALATIAEFKSVPIWKAIEQVLMTIQNGTVITQVWGIRLLAGLSKADKQYKERLLPVLFDYLENCRPVDFATRTETILPVISSAEERETMLQIIRMKEKELSDAQRSKLNRVLKKAR
jgi:hypothetical protein